MSNLLCEYAYFYIIKKLSPVIMAAASSTNIRHNPHIHDRYLVPAT